MKQELVLRGKVTAHLTEQEKGLVEVVVGGYSESQDKLHARVMQSMRGVYWLPEVGDVVDVQVSSLPGCEAQILHTYCPQENAQTEACWTETNDRKQLSTRSGHIITLDDTQDKTSILIQSAGGLLVFLDDQTQQITLKGKDADAPALCIDLKNNSLLLSAPKQVTLACGDSQLEMEENGKVEIKAKGRLEVNAQEISLNAQSKFTIQGQQVELAASMSAKVEGQSQLSLSSSTSMSLQSPMIKLG